MCDNICGKLYAYNASLGNSKFNVLDASKLFFPDFLRAQNMVLSYRM